MYIISKFKDYYDSALGVTGVDKSIIYDRKLIELENEKIPIEAYKPIINRENFWGVSTYFFSPKKDGKYQDVDYFIVGFCGKHYVGFRFYEKIENSLNKELSYEIKYDVDFIKKNIEFKPKYNFGSGKKNQLNHVIKQVSENRDDSIFRKYNTPCYIYYPQTKLFANTFRNGSVLAINCKLKDFQFAKIFDPYTAFQEIQMYISGVLGTNENETINISDKDRIAAHGFDKWSFRKPPENS